MKKNIRIAAALCAAVFALPVLAGCDNGEVTDEGTVGGNGSASGGNTGTSQGGTSGGDTGDTGNTGDAGTGGNSGTSGGNTGTSQGGTGDGGDTGDTGDTGNSGDGDTSGGDTGNTGNTGDSGDSGNGDTSGGTTGNVAQNLFKGKTIEYTHNKRNDYEDGSWSEDYYKISMTFATDTIGRHVSEYRYSNSNSERPDEGNSAIDIVYSLESVNDKNLLYIEAVDSVAAEVFDEYINSSYHGISSVTKAQLFKQYNTLYYYYEFTGDNTVKMSCAYYVGDMGKYDSDFFTIGNNNTSLAISRTSLNLRYYKTDHDGIDDDKTYWGIPQFSNNDFTVDMYRVDKIENKDTYVEIGSLVGTYTIEGTGGKCDGTITFTQLPAEMQDLFAASYQIRNYDLEDDEDRYVYWQEFTIVADTE